MWNLSDYRSGVFLQAEGVEGLHFPTVTDWTSDSPAVHGQYYRGHTTDAREAFWPVLVYSEEDSADWLKRDRAFWRSLLPGKSGTWSVTDPDGGRRSLSLRVVPQPHSFPVDPVRNGWASYGVTLIADDPFWYGEPVRKPWGTDEPVDFYGGPAGKGPDMYIAGGNQMSSATLTNPGDLEAWPVWTVDGPGENVTIGVNGQQVSYSGALLAGDSLVVDTDPTVQTAWLNGADVTGDLSSDNFAPIPAGSDVPLSLSMLGTGKVTAEIRPRFYRAW